MTQMLNKKFNTTMLVGALAIMLAALFWSLDGTFIRPKLYSLPAGLVVFTEHLLGFIVLVPFLIPRLRQLKNLDRKSWGAAMWVSFFGGFLGTLAITQAFFSAMDGVVTFATVVILQKLQPLFALLIARLLLKEKLSKQFYAWAGLAVVAAYFLAFGKHGFVLSDIDFWHSAAFYAIVAAFAFGSSTVFGKRLVNHLDFKSTAALRFGLTIIITGVYLIFSSGFSQYSIVSSTQWWMFALIVFTSGAVAMFFYYFGLRRVSASVATICELFWPFSAVILDYFFNHNTLNATQIGAAIVLIGAMYMVVRRGKVKTVNFTAKAIAGEGRGKSLGTPTVNLDKTDLDLTHGIYTAKVAADGKIYPALLHFGFKETFNDKLSLELYLHNFNGELHNQEVRVEVLEKIREVKKFQSKEDLIAQMEEDKKMLNEIMI
ncbi:MAG: EamA family transporter [Patescibacteria group bacterium]